MLQIVICEDNKQYLHQLVDTINEIVTKNKIDGKIVCTATNADEVEQFISHSPANTFFLDIELSNNQSGFSLAEKIRKNNIHAYIVFITGHFEYVLHAFKVYSFDFLPKPVTDEVLNQCLMRIYENYLIASNSYEYIEVKSGSSAYKIKLDNIVYIERLKRDTIIYLKNGRITCHETLENMDKMINSDDFIRCHKSFIANKQYINEIHLKEKLIVFETGQKCSFGRSYRAQIDSVMKV